MASAPVANRGLSPSERNRSYQTSSHTRKISEPRGPSKTRRALSPLSSAVVTRNRFGDRPHPKQPEEIGDFGRDIGQGPDASGSPASAKTRSPFSASIRSSSRAREEELAGSSRAKDACGKLHPRYAIDQSYHRALAGNGIPDPGRNGERVCVQSRFSPAE